MAEAAGLIHKDSTSTLIDKWFPMPENGAEDDDVATQTVSLKSRPARLGLGAKYVPHNPMLDASARRLEAKLKRSRDEEEERDHDDGDDGEGLNAKTKGKGTGKTDAAKAVGNTNHSNPNSHVDSKVAALSVKAPRQSSLPSSLLIPDDIPRAKKNKKKSKKKKAENAAAGAATTTTHTNAPARTH
eukprot:TRINITY_DN4066_c0_g1::TRINITY_DN4066_c0_g1_i1::g.11991::m.11991 TRINITY_DN4066_c0_g1::TRINITY_DN4066_c0_g1_i1::g.11991  ORF type:complete len:197 (+),score=24.45,BAGE/PF08180.6/0.29,G-patch_2/PF12656.2/0.18,G-patch_2/PF12656.2/5.1e+03,G-patch_2/PF12656.2/4.9e+03,G-patch_2/PF12656.2/9.3e+02,HGTP_anticodon2/PF12745.2/1.1 TRINITY_DN4066_c0_g1_i1:34-591(+)